MVLRVIAAEQPVQMLEERMQALRCKSRFFDVRGGCDRFSRFVWVSWECDRAGAGSASPK
ncbi:MAG: hypothetical protein M3O33_09475 [Cyanobacteriota bacterium]|nr:hypothetical protein [Cyanobacteriota bacterium]